MAQPTITTANPGNLVVPLSTIIDELKGKLTSVEIDALLAAIIAKKKTEVRPGDLITADLMNQVLQDLQDLNTQVAQLTGGAPSTANSQAVVTFTDAWSAYGTLVKNGTFLPTDTSADALKSAAEITAYLQDVMYAALSGGTLGYSGDSNALLDGFTRLYAKQHDVVVLFLAPIPGISDSSSQKQFATLLNVLLEQDSAGGDLSLKKAIDNLNLQAAIAAQNRVDDMVRNQGGDVTTGNLEVKYQGAVGPTETLVIGSAQPVLYRFTVANKTNRNVDAQLKAEFLPPRQSWTTNLSIVGIDGSAVSDLQLVPFDSGNPQNPSATKEVRVSAMTPPGAVDQDTGVLQFTAAVPEPINRSGVAKRQLTVAKTATTQTPGIVSYSAQTPIVSGSLSNATEQTPVSLKFEINFSALQGPASRTFTFRLDISAPSNPDPLFQIQFAPSLAKIDSAASTAILKKSVPFPMTDGSQQAVTVFVTPLTGSKNSSLTFTATVQSATDNITVTTSAITIAVKN